MNILIYGVGGFTKRYFPTTKEITECSHINLTGFIDKRAKEYKNGYEGLPVFLPTSIPELMFDKIYIFAFDDAGLYREIYYSLIREYGVHESKIGGIADLLMMAQRLLRNSSEANQTRTPQIYDCVQFFNEIEILRMRMEILAPYVDHFVVVEMTRDHHGRKKPLYLQDRLGEFKEFKDKIILVHPNEDEIPKYESKDRDEYGFIWTIEQFQRRCIAKGLTGAQPEDLIIISDCDEIPKPAIIQELRSNIECAYPTILGKMIEETAIALRQEYYFFYFNCRNKMRKNTTTIVKYKNMINPQIIRDVMNCLPYIDYGGWHLTYFGGKERIKEKISSIVEGVEVSDEEINYRTSNAKDIYGREGDEFNLEYLPLKEITIPDIEKWKERYPQFYLER